MARAPRNTRGGKPAAAATKRKPRNSGTDAEAVVERNAAATAATIISPEAFVKAMKSLASLRTKSREAAGDAGEFMRKLTSPKSDGGKGCDKRAVAILERLSKMSDNQLQVTLPFLLWGIDALKLGERATNQGQLPVEADDDDEKAEEADPKPGARVPLSIVPNAMDDAVNA